MKVLQSSFKMLFRKLKLGEILNFIDNKRRIHTRTLPLLTCPPENQLQSPKV